MPIIFPTAYFGNLSYVRAMAKQKEVQIEAKDHFLKQTLRNRCEILTSQGVQALTVPVIRNKGSKTPSDEVMISKATDWQKDHWKAIESAYASAPYFEHYGQEVKALIYQEEEQLLRFNWVIQQQIIEWWQLPINTNFTTEFQSDALVYTHQTQQSVQLSTKPYIQVFGGTQAFTDNLSVLDALFCLGPMARNLMIATEAEASVLGTNL